MDNTVRTDKAGLIPEVQKMLDQNARLGAISAVDLGDKFDVIYHFEVPLDFAHIRVEVDKNDVLPSISGIYLAAVTSENEVREQLGVKIEDIALDYHWRFLLGEESPTVPLTLPVEGRIPTRLSTPCKEACPAGVDAPRYVRLIGEGRVSEALAVIKRDLPFPGIIGRICLAPCEKACRQARYGEPICIRLMKRFAYEHGTYEEKVTAKPTGKRVAIIGAGPAGLAAACFLARMGHSVDILDALPEPGGLMRLGISETRLPREVLEDDIGIVKKLGVNIKTGTRVDSLDELLSDGYQAVLVAIGSHAGLRRSETVTAMTGHSQVAKQFDLRMRKVEGGAALDVDEETMATSREGIFAAGEAVTGQANVTSSIGSAKKAAIGIDRYLGGSGELPEVEMELHDPTSRHTFIDRWKDIREVQVKLVDGMIRAVVTRKRPEMPYFTEEEASKRGEDEVGLSEEAAIAEGQRCWRCDLEE